MDLGVTAGRQLQTDSVWRASMMPEPDCCHSSLSVSFISGIEMPQWRNRADALVRQFAPGEKPDKLICSVKDSRSAFLMGEVILCSPNR